MRRNPSVLILAVLIGLVGSLLAYRYLKTQQERLDEARQKAVGSIIEIVVADAEIPLGTKIQPAQVRLVKWPQDAEPQDAIRTPESAVGKTTRVTVRKNQPLVGSDLLSDQASLLPLLIENGMRAISIRVDRIMGVSGFITPESRVDVLTRGSIDDGGDNIVRSKLILQNVKVIATGTELEQKEGGAQEVPVVTLVVTPGDAEKIALATKESMVYLALRSYSDNSEVSTPGQTLRKLYGLGDPPRPRIEPPIVPAAPPPAAPVAKPVERRVVRSIEVLLGEEVTRQSY